MQSCELIAGSLRKNFYTAIVIVSYPSRDSKQMCLALHEPAKTYPLHASADEIALGLDGFVG